MGDAHRRSHFIDVLPARAPRMEDVDADVLIVYLHLHVLRLGQHRHRRRGRMDPSLRFRFGHPLHAVHAALVLQKLIRALSRNVIHRFLDAAKLRFVTVRDLHFQAVIRAVALIHTAKLRRKQRRFLPARARADLQNTAPFVVLVLGQQQYFEFLFQRGKLFLTGIAFVGKQLPHLLVALRFRLREGFFHLLLASEILKILFRRFPYLRVFLGILLPRAHVRDHRGIGKLRGQKFIAF